MPAFEITRPVEREVRWNYSTIAFHPRPHLRRECHAQVMAGAILKSAEVRTAGMEIKSVPVVRRIFAERRNPCIDKQTRLTIDYIHPTKVCAS